MNDQSINDMTDIDVIIGEAKKIKVRGKIYHLSASPVSDLPKLINKIEEFERIDATTVTDEKALRIMAETIFLGLKEHQKEITVEEIQENFPLSAFPILINIMLDINDFLSNMGKMRQTTSNLKNLADSSLELREKKSLSRPIKKKKISRN